MLSILLPVYERLSDPALLEWCARVWTQNANECVNGEIWSCCQKAQWFRTIVVTISAAMGVMVFNVGEFELNRIKKLGLEDRVVAEEHAEKER